MGGDRSITHTSLVDLRCQDEIAFCQTVDIVRPNPDLDFTPGKKDVWVVLLLLRKLTYQADGRWGGGCGHGVRVGVKSRV